MTTFHCPPCIQRQEDPQWSPQSHQSHSHHHILLCHPHQSELFWVNLNFDFVTFFLLWTRTYALLSPSSSPSYNVLSLLITRWWWWWEMVSLLSATDHWDHRATLHTSCVSQWVSWSKQQTLLRKNTLY